MQHISRLDYAIHFVSRSIDRTHHFRDRLSIVIKSQSPKVVRIPLSLHPTSIIWRYAAVVDRRIRATKWCPDDLAATNAIFWTTKGWNRDESMVATAVSYRVQNSKSPHVNIFSVTTLKTVIFIL
jgi:hypothetical protein